MKRTQFRNLWLVVVILLGSGAYYVFQQAETERANIQRAQNRLNALRQERINAENLSAALTELDQLTLDENDATRLEILRHLGIETNDYNFTIQGQSVRQIQGVNVNIRQVQLESVLPYRAALKLMDEMQANRKLLVESVVVERVPQSMYRQVETVFAPDLVQVTIKGQIYGLEKRTL